MSEKLPLLDCELPNENKVSEENNILDSTLENEVLFDTKFRYWKNLLALCFSFTFILTSFVALQNLESTLNQDAGLGVTSLACIYGSAVLVAIFSPVVVRLAGPKKTILAGFVGHLTYVLCNAYPQFYTLIPASVLLGSLGSLMWTGHAYFLTSLATGYAVFLNGSVSNSIARFNGIFFFFFQNPQIWGNLISSSILSSENATYLNTTNRTSSCGIGFCNLEVASQEGKENSKTLLYILLGIFVLCDILGILLTVCLVDDIAIPTPSQTTSLNKSVWGTLHHHGNRRMLLLIPFFTYNGIEQAFLASEYTQAFPGCSLGLGSIGYVMVCFGVTNACSSIIVGRLEKYVGRIILFTVAAMLNLAMLITLMLWDPTTTSQVLFYVIPAIWGIADGIWQPLTCSFLGLTFLSQLEVTFAVFRMWQFAGFVLLFGMSYFVCMATKVAIVTAVLLLGILLYYMVEVDISRNSSTT